MPKDKKKAKVRVVLKENGNLAKVQGDGLLTKDEIDTMVSQGQTTVAKLEEVNAGLKLQLEQKQKEIDEVKRKALLFQEAVVERCEVVQSLMSESEKAWVEQIEAAKIRERTLLDNIAQLELQLAEYTKERPVNSIAVQVSFVDFEANSNSLSTLTSSLSCMGRDEPLAAPSPDSAFVKPIKVVTTGSQTTVTAVVDTTVKPLVLGAKEKLQHKFVNSYHCTKISSLARKKFNGYCFVCNAFGHKASYCKCKIRSSAKNNQFSGDAYKPVEVQKPVDRISHSYNSFE